MQRWQCPIHNAIHLKLCQIKFELDNDVKNFQTVFFLNCGCLSDLLKLNLWENDNIFPIIDQIKISRVSLRIGHWHGELVEIIYTHCPL